MGCAACAGHAALPHEGHHKKRGRRKAGRKLQEPPYPQQLDHMKRGVTVLLGILSAPADRRRALRCVYARLAYEPGAALAAASVFPVRPIFVVGRKGGGVPPTPQPKNDVLLVNVTDRVGGVQMSTRGTAAALLKQAHFLRFAVQQPEEVIAIQDDDTFVNLPALHFLSASISAHLGGRPFYSGVFEYYNWQPYLLRATGFGGGYMPNTARKAGRRLHNCSAEPYDPRGDENLGEHPYRARCVGIFQFGKGPLVMMSRKAVEVIVASPDLARDVARAETMEAGAQIRHPIQPDVHLGDGYLLATLVPRLVYVWFPKGSFNDRRGGASYATGEPLDGATLLAAHRVPYVCWGKLLDVARAWSNPNVTFGSRKRSLPPSVHVWHNQSQMELQLPPPPFERIHLLSCNESTATGFKLGDASCDAEAASDDSWRRIRR